MNHLPEWRGRLYLRFKFLAPESPRGSSDGSRSPPRKEEGQGSGTMRSERSDEEWFRKGMDLTLLPTWTRLSRSL